MYNAQVLADSTDDRFGKRLISIVCTFPRYLLAEVNTHRVFSRNSASSRAIPVPIRVKQVTESPFVPEFTKNKAGMSADDVLDPSADAEAERIWRAMAAAAADGADQLAKVKVHKQQANRILEPYVWHTAIITSTEWENFFALRVHNAAAPEMQKIARIIEREVRGSTPKKLHPGEWHMPFVTQPKSALEATAEEVDEWLCESVARCAAISFDRHLVSKPKEDYTNRRNEMVKSGHWSPLEHQARVATSKEIIENATFHTGKGRVMERGGAFVARSCELIPHSIGNFSVPWFQYRKMFPNEAVFCG